MLWRAAREHQSIPACPTDFSEPRWAALLYGGTNCQVRNMPIHPRVTLLIKCLQICCKKGVQKVDFILRRRVCSKCKKSRFVSDSSTQQTLHRYLSRLISAPAFRRLYQDRDEKILDLIPTLHGELFIYHSLVYLTCADGVIRFWWASDIEEVVTKWDALSKTAYPDLTAFQVERLAFVKHVIEVCQLFHPISTP